MNKLIVFGDSNSLPFFGNEIETEKYRQYKGGTLPKGWMEILSEKMNLNLVNHSKMGLCNSNIFQIICDKIRYVQPNDVVIIGWTFKMRYQVVSVYDGGFCSFSNVLPSFLPEHTSLSPETMSEFLVHKNHDFWVNEVYSYEKIITHLSEIVGFKVYFWSFDEEIGKSYKNNTNMNYYLGKENLLDYYHSDSYKKLNTKIQDEWDFVLFGFWRHLEQLGMKQICDETNGEVNDGHIDELGHIILADLFYYQITKKNGLRI
jgi:hypothetical protein